MIRSLLGVRFRALFAGMTAQGRKKKKRNIGLVILLVFLYIYLAAVIGGVMCFTFASLADAYHSIGLDWLYFALAGLMALGLSVFGSVFATQSQLYDAKDNELLLAMPIKPQAILLSRMIPLLALNFLFAGIVMIPATVMYAILVKFSLWGVLAQLVSLLAICLLAQAIACLLGWLLHLLLTKLNKSFASLLYMIIFLAVYFSIYSQAGEILQTVAASGQTIANTLQSWVWPLYAMGLGCLSNPLYCLAFAAICTCCFGAVYWFLSVTFLRTATAQRSSRRKRRLDIDNAKTSSPMWAITVKELRKFTGSPVYLTNMGVGIIMTIALPIAGIIFRDTIRQALLFLDPSGKSTPLLICAVLSFTVSTCCISTPSVSLEGKNLWILRSVPLSSKDILLAKLNCHMLVAVPAAFLVGLLLGIIFGCSVVGTILCAIIPGLLATLCGVFGMWAGLQWAKLDYISDVYPCKQSASVLVVMFGMMGVPVVLGLGYALLAPFLSPTAFLALCALLLSAACYGLYRVVITWGARKWESL